MADGTLGDRPRDGFLAHYLGPLAEWLEDPRVSEIVVNPDGRIWIERAGQAAMVETGARLSPTEATRLARQIAGEAGHRLFEAHPMAGCKLPIGDGATLRVQIVTPPIVEQTALSIRRIALQRFSLGELAARGALE